MRLIDADAIPVVSADPYEEAAFRDTIEDMPTIDPVKHGKWVEKSYDYYVCSVCGEPAICDEADTILTDYCPNCGAKMDGGEDGE